MKRVRHGRQGRERPGAVDGAGNIRDLGGICGDFDPAFFAGDGAQRIRGIDLGRLPLAPKKRLQDSSTSDMIFSVPRLVADCSQYVLLQPGDIITTGMPPGVGLGMKPAWDPKPRDVMRLGIDGLGI